MCSSDLRPWRFRLTSLVYHLESFALRSLPIIALINFLVGCIVAQQGIFQLRRFGATAFAVDLIGILVLRELAVLLTSIMIAGRSGSAITAELGSMKMREEIDALQVIGLDPADVLILPRLIALLLALPLLTFVADLAALVGGAFVSYLYSNIPVETFIDRLRDAVGLNTLVVGLIKAPFMGLIIGVIAANEGLRVAGSAESLGRQTTASVVKSIFMVIVLDGLFAVFFALITVGVLAATGRLSGPALILWWFGWSVYEVLIRLQGRRYVKDGPWWQAHYRRASVIDRKSTRLNSSH